jgi:hypothetical protein
MVKRTCLNVTLHVRCLSSCLVAHSHLAVVEAVATFSVLNFGITVLFDVTHIERLVQFCSVAARNGHILCPGYLHARYDATSIIASFSALSFANKWLHPLPSTARLTVHSSCSRVLHKVLTVLSLFCHLCTTCTWQCVVFVASTTTRGSMRWRSWLRHCATSWKVAGSIPDGVIGVLTCICLSARYFV